MTLTADELRRARAVAEPLIEWRKWRRSMHLTIPEAAAMAGVSAEHLQRLETGTAREPNTQTLAKLRALMARWSEDMRPTKSDRRGGRRERTQRR